MQEIKDTQKEQWEIPVLLELNPSASQAADFADPFDADGGPGPS
jgi:hypothetical protein